RIARPPASRVAKPSATLLQNAARKLARTTSKKKGNMKLDTLKQIYTTEEQSIKGVPKMAKGASSPELKDAFQKHLEQTKGHVERLEQLFDQLDESPKGKTCHGMKGLIEEGSEILKKRWERRWEGK